MPVIRYRTRDLTRLLPGSVRTMRRMDRITGRSDDMLIIRGVNVFPTQIEEIVLQHGQLSGEYLLHVSRDGLLDALEVRCELRPGASDVTDDALRRVAQEVCDRVKVQVGVTAMVSVLPHATLERQQAGKARRVIDVRPR
jgi:phenylacetate-CoA ligase